VTTGSHLLYSRAATTGSYVRFGTENASALLLLMEEIMGIKRRLGIAIAVATAVVLAALSVVLVVPIVEQADAQVAPISTLAVPNFTV